MSLGRDSVQMHPLVGGATDREDSSESGSRVSADVDAAQGRVQAAGAAPRIARTTTYAYMQQAVSGLRSHAAFPADPGPWVPLGQAVGASTLLALGLYCTFDCTQLDILLYLYLPCVGLQALAWLHNVCCTKNVDVNNLRVLKPTSRPFVHRFFGATMAVAASQPPRPDIVDEAAAAGSAAVPLPRYKFLRAAASCLDEEALESRTRTSLEAKFWHPLAPTGPRQPEWAEAQADAKTPKMQGGNFLGQTVPFLACLLFIAGHGYCQSRFALAHQILETPALPFASPLAFV